MIIALVFVLAAAASARVLSPPSCARGASFEVYSFDPAHSFHSISGSSFAKSVGECADLCANAAGCTCAFYGLDSMCAWRTDPCSTSEMYIDSKPTLESHGLIALCSRTIDTFRPCHASGPCCKETDECVEKNRWYSQCLPRGTKLCESWTGRVHVCSRV